jgi:glycosyltransferase involved in cell wall biosynthesis
MKVLHVATTNARGGAENHLADLIAGQLARGLEVQCAFLKGDGYWTETFEAQECKVHNLGMRAYGDPRPVATLKRILSGFGPDIVHAHLPPAELYMRLALMGRTEPLVISKHNDQTFYRGNVDIFVERWCAARATTVICISQAVQRFFAARWSGDLGRRLSVLRYGLDPAPYTLVDDQARAALRHEWGVSPEALLFGTVARLVPQKSLHTLITAFSHFRKRRPDVEARLVMVGRGPLEASLRSLAEQLGVSNEIIWAGFRTDIPVVMNAMDVFVLSSIFEGFGLVLLEAMAASRPIVATRVSAIPEVVGDGGAGVLVRPETPDDMAMAMIDILSPDRRRDMGQLGLQRVQEHFRLDDMIDATVKIYNGCSRRVT